MPPVFNRDTDNSSSGNVSPQTGLPQKKQSGETKKTSNKYSNGRGG